MSDTISAVVSRSRPHRDHPALYIGLSADTPDGPPARLTLAGLDRVDIHRADAFQVTCQRDDEGERMVIALTDVRLSQRHARLTRVGQRWVFEDLSSKNGSWLNGRRVAIQPLADGDVMIVGHTALVYRTSGGSATNQTGFPSQLAPGLQTMVPALERRFAELASAAGTSITIEINGETGTGKELVARGVHALSGRLGTFVAVNCGGLASSLLEGELFGHRKGAFTGAADERLGLIRSADRGTLFLDEIAELPAPSQASLLRVLQEREVTPLGADRPVPVDLRVVTATHADLDDAVAAGRFRADLRARLLGFQIEIPALRDRPEDLGLVVGALLRRDRSARIAQFSVDAISALYLYDWPLNVRELERALAAAVIVARDRVELMHLPLAVRSVLETDEPPPPDEDLSDADRALRDKLAVALANASGNIAMVARELGKDRTQIRRWMKRFGLRRD